MWYCRLGGNRNFFTGSVLRFGNLDPVTPVRLNRFGSIMTMFFTAEDVIDYATALKADRERYAAYFRGMLQRGVFLAPSQFEAMFVSTTHGDEEVIATGEAAEASLRDLDHA